MAGNTLLISSLHLFLTGFFYLFCFVGFFGATQSALKQMLYLPHIYSLVTGITPPFSLPPGKETLTNLVFRCPCLCLLCLYEFEYTLPGFCVALQMSSMRLKNRQAKYIHSKKIHMGSFTHQQSPEFRLHTEESDIKYSAKNCLLLWDRT